MIKENLELLTKIDVKIVIEKLDKTEIKDADKEKLFVLNKIDDTNLN